MADPGPVSLRDLVRHHTKFLVNPLQWTSRHLELVGCRFGDIRPGSASKGSAKDDPQKQQNGRSQTQHDAEVVATTLYFSLEHRSLVNILVNKERAFAYHSKGPKFYFEGRVAHKPNFIAFDRYEKSTDMICDSSPPLIGYLHYSHVRGDRRKQFKPCPAPGRLRNFPGIDICRKRLAQTTPKEWTEDPYFLCHLLALAQRQEDQFVFPTPTSYTARLLVKEILDREHILLCQAEISGELLTGLSDPKNSPSPIAWPIIHRTKIPYKPYDTFAERLVAELVSPSPNKDADFQFHWRQPSEQEMAISKRRRSMPSTCTISGEHDRRKVHRKS